jgi:hypothetical protein
VGGRAFYKLLAIFIKVNFLFKLTRGAAPHWWLRAARAAVTELRPGGQNIEL